MVRSTRELMTLFEIAEREGTGKSSHGYCPFYETLLAQYIDRECTLLEMGIGSGASLKTWRQWLPKSKIVGLEQDEPTCERCKSDDYEVVLGNQSNVKDLQRLVQGRFFDIIIDDAGHDRNEQLVAFHFLFDHVYPGGWYIIEDVDTGNENESVILEVTRPISTVAISQGESKIKQMHIFGHKRGSCILFLNKR